MNRLILSITVISIFLLNPFIEKAQNKKETKDEWKVVAVGGNVVNYAYNPKKLTKKKNGILRVWIKETLKDNSESTRKAFIEFRSKLGLSVNGYERYSHSFELWEYNCVERTSQVFSSYDYDTDGLILDKVEIQRPIWSAVVPNSVGELIINAICKE